MTHRRRLLLRRTLALVAAGLLSIAHGAPAQAQQAGALVAAAAPGASPTSGYRGSAARHIYATYAASIYHGMLPPLVHAIVVVETDVDGQGNVRSVRPVRSPSHAPEVTDDVRRLILRASPFPAPGGADGARFTEVWLVDHSGRFQLHTLTEGQR